MEEREKIESERDKERSATENNNNLCLEDVERCQMLDSNLNFRGMLNETFHITKSNNGE